MTMLWQSDGGRDYPPWSGRHTGCLGVEEGAAALLLGLSTEAELPWPGALSLSPGGLTEVRHVIGAIAWPTEEPVAEVQLDGDAVTIRGERGAERRVPIRHRFPRRRKRHEARTVISAPAPRRLDLVFTPRRARGPEAPATTLHEAVDGRARPPPSRGSWPMRATSSASRQSTRRFSRGSKACACVFNVERQPPAQHALSRLFARGIHVVTTGSRSSR
jgi:hypothetical protein